MTLYTYNGAYPAELPFRIKLSNGKTRTDPSTFTVEEIADAGFIEVADKPVPEYPQKVEWLNMQWVVRDPNEAETAFKWQEIRNRCQQLLEEADYKVTKAIEAAAVNGTTIAEELDPAYTTYRQELRDLYNNVNNIDPWNVVYPLLRFEQDPIPSE